MLLIPNFRMKFCLVSLYLLLGACTLNHAVALLSTSSSQVHSTKLVMKASDDVSRWAAAVGIGAALLGAPLATFADGQTSKFSLPPVDQKTPVSVRCVFKSSSIGQANAARDKLYDLRLCDMSGGAAEGYDLSGAIMSEAKFEKVNFRDAQLSKVYAVDSNFDGSDFSNGVVDRVTFKGSSMKGAIFQNAVLTGTSFENANVENTDFSESYMGDFDQRNLCKNPTLKGENPVTGVPTKESAGCR